jgi:hypothetical protein
MVTVEHRTGAAPAAADAPAMPRRNDNLLAASYRRPSMPRRYFYDIDRRGEVWHDGTMLTDEVFLRQFFRRLRRDERAAFADHPFVSPCAGEENRVRAEVTPIVFRRLIGSALLANGGVVVPFQPESLRVDRDGRLFHAAPVGGVGLLLPDVVSDLAPQLAMRDGGYVFRDGERTLPIAALD